MLGNLLLVGWLVGVDNLTLSNPDDAPLSCITTMMQFIVGALGSSAES